MLHRILDGEKAVDVATGLLKGKQLMAAFDLAPIFVNKVRVVSLPQVITPEQVDKFDDMLSEAGAQQGVQWMHDVGAYLRVVGRQIQV